MRHDRAATMLLESVAAGELLVCWPRTTRTLSKKAVAKCVSWGSRMIMRGALCSDHGHVRISWTLALGKSGYNSHKLVLFGEFAELFHGCFGGWTRES